MPNVMAALPNIGGALCSTLQSLADAHYYKNSSGDEIANVNFCTTTTHM